MEITIYKFTNLKMLPILSLTLIVIVPIIHNYCSHSCVHIFNKPKRCTVYKVFMYFILEIIVCAYIIQKSHFV